jgi:hypothetical protein
MSIDYLKQIYAYKTGFNFSTTSPVNSVLLETAVNPLLPVSRTTISAGATSYNLYHHCPAGYVASRFRYWRGSMRYRLKLVKTEFHTGKLLVCWVPFNNQAQPYTSPPNVEASYYRYRQIIDISQGNEFEFIVPYMSPRPWKSVLPTENGGFNVTPATPAGARAAATDFANGYFTVLVLDQLRAPDACAQTIRVVLEASGGPDFEVCNPNVNKIYHNNVEYNGPHVAWTAFYQSAAEGKTISSYTFGNHAPMSHETTVAITEISGGEKIDNLRKLMKRYTMAYQSVDGIGHRFIVAPWSGMGLEETAATIFANSLEFEDDFAFFGAMYGLFRGSVRCKFYATATGAQTSNIARHQLTANLMDCPTGMRNDIFTYAFAQPVPSSGSWAGFDPTYDGGSARALAVAALTEALEFTIPFYNKDCHVNVQAMYNHENIPGTASLPGVSSGEIGVPSCAAIVNILTGANITLRKRFDRSLGEDASFSYFISCPPIFDPREDLVL